MKYYSLIGLFLLSSVSLVFAEDDSDDISKLEITLSATLLSKKGIYWFNFYDKTPFSGDLAMKMALVQHVQVLD